MEEGGGRAAGSRHRILGVTDRYLALPDIIKRQTGQPDSPLRPNPTQQAPRARRPQRAAVVLAGRSLAKLEATQASIERVCAQHNGGKPSLELWELDLLSLE